MATNFTYCSDKGFRQHSGECWNDAIQMIFCFCDGIKEYVQYKIFNFTADQCIENAYNSPRVYYLPYSYKDDKKTKDHLVDYVSLLENRLCNYTNSYTEKHNIKKVPRCKKYDTIYSNPIKKDIVGLLYKRSESMPERRRRSSDILGPVCSTIGLQIISNATVHGSTTIINMLSYLFLDNNDMVVARSYLYKMIKKDHLNNVIAIYVTANYKFKGHAVCFYKCDENMYYYDDNFGITLFDWIGFFNFYLENRYDMDICITNYPVPLLRKKSDNTKFINFTNFSTVNPIDIDTENIMIVYTITTLQIANVPIKQNKIPIELFDQFMSSEIVHGSPCNIIKYAIDYKITGTYNIVDKSILGHICSMDITSCQIDLTNYFKNVYCNLNKKDLSDGYLIFYAINNKNINMLKFLCENGVNKDIYNNIGETPLIIAINMHLTDIIKMLCEYGVNKDQINRDGYTPMSMAIKQSSEVVEILCQYGVNKDKNDKFLETPLSRAIKMEETDMIEILCQYGANRRLNNGKGEKIIDLVHRYYDDNKVNEILEYLKC